jgi:hypothetical protein
VDTNVLLDIATQDPIWFSWSSGHLARVINAREAAINPVIYAELAPLYRSARELDLNLVPPADFRRLLLPFPQRARFRPTGKPVANGHHLFPTFSSAPMQRRRDWFYSLEMRPAIGPIFPK